MAADDELEEAEAARDAVAEAGRRTASRRELSRHESFEEVSPEVGILDEDAFDEAFDEDPDEALAMLADLVGATDRRLADLARQLAARIMVTFARAGSPRRGIGRLRSAPLVANEGDLDLDRSMDALAAARFGAAADPNDLRVTTWDRPATAVCLLVDRSGSMAGDRLAAAAVAAASVAYRAPQDCSVVCFSDRSIVVKAQDETRAVEEVVSDVLTLRGFGITDVGLALRTAARQLGRSTAGRRVAVLLSDCRATTGGDPLPHAAGIDELVVIAPEGDSADAEALANSLRVRWTTLAGPSDVPGAFERLLGR
ncbi:MAG: VWA domain-containing protein [Actinomycetia bacterium]|nr:VWA domain-containing protein [Actinomycetes bacterium]